MYSKKMKYAIFSILAVLIILGLTSQKNSPIITTVIFICVVAIDAIFLFKFTKKATQKVSTCIAWLFFMPIITIGVADATFRSIIGSNFYKNQYLVALAAILIYLITWLIMALFGEIKTTKHAIFTLGCIFVILFLVFDFIIDLFPPKVLEVSFLYHYTNEVKAAGYQIQDLVHLSVNMLFYPAVITSIVSYWTIKLRELKAK